MKLQPLKNRLIVQPLNEQLMVNGILAPQEYSRGRVIRCGSDVVGIEEGMIVAYDPTDAMPLTTDDVSAVLIIDDKVIAYEDN